MMTKLRSILFVLAFALVLSACGGGDAIVLRNGLIITMAGSNPIPNGVVVIENGVITTVGTEIDVAVPNGATVIDVEGRTILPGLIDAHTHILNNLRFEDGEVDDISIDNELSGQFEVGVTTLRDLGTRWSTEEELSAIKTALNARKNTIPTVYIAGYGMVHTESPLWINAWSDDLLGVATVDEARAATQELVDADVDQIKIFLRTRPLGGSSSDGNAPSLNVEQVRAIVDVAHENGLKVSAHIEHSREVEIILAGGVDNLAHWPSWEEPLPEDVLQMLVDKSIPVVSTFGVSVPAEGDVRRFLDAGGVLVFGTDFVWVGTYPENEHMEIENMLNAGMIPSEILQSATINAAQVLGLEDSLGSLEAGKQADIIVVDGNPLEDFSVMQSVIYVIKNGELVVKPE